MDINVQQMEVKTDINKEGIKKVNERLEHIKDTKDILDYFNDEIRGVQHQLNHRITENTEKTVNKINKIIQEELTHEEGLFGKEDEETQAEDEEHKGEEEVKSEEIKYQEQLIAANSEGENSAAQQQEPNETDANEGEAKRDAEAENAVVEEKVVEKKYQFRTLKEFMVAQFKEMKESMMTAAAETQKFRSSNTKKMG